MIIYINENWRIATDPSNWIIQKRNGWYKDKKSGEKLPKWDSIRFPSTLPSALNQLFELRVREIESDVPEEIIRQGKKIASEISQACKFLEKFGKEVLAEGLGEGGYGLTSATFGDQK